MNDIMKESKYKGKKCFVIMPFRTKDGIDFDYVYHELIERAVEGLRIECDRCDEIVGSGSIHIKMFRGIFDAEVSIVDITLMQNANVFYELGVRHALHKNVTIVICKQSHLANIPFNINGINILGYEIDTKKNLMDSRKRIREHIVKGLDDNKSIDSIVYNALPDLSVERRPKPIDKVEEKLYKLSFKPDTKIGYITGNLKNIKNVDVWVNSENTYMQMARHFDTRSISSTIRYGGAKKDKTGYVIEDTIANDLRDVIGRRDSLPPGTVIDTTAGELQRTNMVKRVFHAASVIGQPGVGYTLIPNITDCIRNALELADSAELVGLGLQSILFPLMGAGTSRASAQEMADKLIEAAVCYFEDIKNAKAKSRIKRVYFLVYTEQDREICRHKLINDPRIDTKGEKVSSSK